MQRGKHQLAFHIVLHSSRSQQGSIRKSTVLRLQSADAKYIWGRQNAPLISSFSEIMVFQVPMVFQVAFQAHVEQ